LQKGLTSEATPIKPMYGRVAVQGDYTMLITWRPYQTEIINAVFADWQKHSSVLAVAATGAGKTSILWGIVDRFLQGKPGARVVVLAHRKELIEQPLARLGQYWPHLVGNTGIVMANRDDCEKQIIIATVQTIGTKSGKRLDHLLRFGPIDLLIIDETHHCAAKQYRTVIDRLRERNPALKLLGVTATPQRGDKKSLAEIFQKESANVGVLRLIEEGHLCEPRVHGVKTNIDLSGVSVQGSGGNRDYNQKELVAAVETDDCFKLVVKTHIDKVGNRPTIAFVPSVAGAYRLADMLKAQGIKAAAADGNTPKAEREAILEDFKAGRLTCICNVALWTEGLDLPNLECCHLVRPTKSDALYLQMVGRVLRLYPGKEYADIFDYQPKESRNLEQRMIKLGLKKRPPTGEIIRGGGGIGKVKPKAGDQIEYVLLGYFQKRKEAWLITDNGWRLINLGKGEGNIDRSLAISPDGAQLWVVWREEGQRWPQAKMYCAGDFEQVSKQAEAFVAKHGKQNLVNRDVRWRSRLPTSEKQIEFGRKLGVYNEDMTAGQLSDAINKKLVMQAIDRERKTESHKQAVLASVVDLLAA